MINKNTFPVSVKSFLFAAIDNYNSGLKNLDFEDFAEIEHYKLIIKNMEKDKVKKKTFIKRCYSPC